MYMDGTAVSYILITLFIAAGAAALAGIILLARARARLWGVVPQACHTVFEFIPDAVIVLDLSNRIVSLNQAACQLIDLPASRALGQPVAKAWSDWPAAITWPVNNTVVNQNLTITILGVMRSFNLNIIPLKSTKGKLHGRVIVLQDVTAQKQAEEALHRRDDILDAIGFATQQFMRQASIEEILPEVFSRLGEATHVSRIYLLENQTAADGKVVCIYRHEWNAWRIQPHLSIPILQAFSLEERGLARWIDALSTGEVIHDHLRNLPASEQAFLTERGVHSLVVVPIFLEKFWWGSLGFEDCKTEREWTPLEIDVLRTAADTVGAALQRRQAEQNALRWAEVNQTLLDLTVIIGSTLNISQVLDRVTMAARTLLPVDRAAILLWDEGQNLLLPTPSTSVELARNPWTPEAIEQFGQFKLTPEQVPLLDQLLHSQEAIAIQRVADSPLLPAHLTHLFEITSLLAVPIIYHDRFTGVLYLDYCRTEHTFNHQEINLATALARQAGLAIEHARLFTRSQEDADELSALYRASSTLLTSGIDLQELANQIVQVVTDEFDFAYCSVLILDKEHNLLRTLAQRGYIERNGSAMPVDGPGLTAYAARSGDIVYAPDVSQDPRYLPVSSRTRSEIVIPLKAGNDVIGLLNLESPDVNAFDERARRILTAFADDAALALQNVRLFNAAQIHARQMALLNEITHTALLKTDLHEMLNALANRMNELIASDHCYITLWNAELQQVFPGGASGDLIDLYQNWAPGPGQLTLTAAVLAANAPITVTDAPHSQYLLPGPIGEFPSQTLLGLPMIIGEQKLGAILIGYTVEHTFTNREIAICQQATGQVAIVIENARLYQQARQAAEKRAILHRVSQEIVTASFDGEQIYTAIHHAATLLMPVEAIAITLITPDSTQAEAVYLIDKDGRAPNQLFPKDQGLTGNVLGSGTTINIPDVNQSPNLRGLHFGSQEQTRSVLALPLRAGERIIGMLSVQSYQPNAYSSEDEYLLEMLAATAAIAIENSRLLKEIQWLAITDPLTGLYNRRGLFELAEREVERYRRFGRPFCVYMLDIDLFKQINDTYGHAAGDQVLVGLARRLQQRIRDVDIIGRYGGEEIVVVLPETQLSQALLAAERARNHIQGHPIATDKGDIPVTVSIGVAEIDAQVSDLAALVDRADSAMYAAKQAGRNRVLAYQVEKESVS